MCWLSSSTETLSWTGHITFSISVFLDCGKALVAEIAEGSISSSSVKDYSEAAHVKLDKEGWSPQNADKHPWIKIDLGDLYLVCGFAVQGCSDSGVDTWVTRYRVQVSPEENFWDSWNYIKVINWLRRAGGLASCTLCKISRA